MSGSFAYSSAIGRFVIGLSPIEGSTTVVTPPDAGGGGFVATSDFERLYDNIQTMLPAITLPVIEMELWNTVQEFCIRSTYFRSKIYWEMGPGISTVDFNPFNADMGVVWVLYVHGLTHWAINPPAVLYDTLPPTNGRSGWAQVALRPLRFDVVKLGAIPELFTTWFETMLDGTL